jgi:glutaconate CoA-transferase subunit B
MHYTRRVDGAAAAQEIGDGERFSSACACRCCFAVRRAARANTIGIFENGVVRDWRRSNRSSPWRSAQCRPRARCGGLLDVMYLLQSGRVDLGFIGGAEIDRFGNLNTHWVEDNGKRTRLPGSGGAADIATLAKRCILIMNHERRRFTPQVRYVTSPGYGDGGDWRKQNGLSGGGPSRVLTSTGIFSFDPVDREMVLISNHPGVSVDDIKNETGWPLRVSPDIHETAPPTADELAAVRKYDPKGVWTS